VKFYESPVDLEFFIKKVMIIFLLVTAGALYCEKNIKVPAVPVKDYELKDDQRKEWNAIRGQWFRNDYREILKKFNLQMNCSDCEYVYITVRLHVDDSGRITKFEIIKEHICRGGATEKLREAFFKYFKNIKLPESLRNLIIETNLGTGLSC
jgi:hypothetical protein